MMSAGCAAPRQNRLRAAGLDWIAVVDGPTTDQVLAGARAGTVVDLSANVDRQIPAEVLLKVLTAEPELHPRGVRILGARITGEMAWDWQQLAAPLELVDCTVDQPIILDHAQIAGLSLIRCQVPGLSAEQVISSSTLRFDGSVFSGTVVLRGASISGELRAVGTSIQSDRDRNGVPIALYATGIRITGALNLSAGFAAHGTSRLLGAQIGGNLLATGGRFVNPGADALQLADSDIAGSIILGQGFESEGKLFLSRATVRGNVSCDGAHLNGAGDDAMSADRIEIRGGLFMRTGFRASGRIHLVNSRIGGNLDCTDGIFDADQSADAIWAGGARIEGSVLLRGGFRSQGRVRLVDAQIGGSLVCDGATMAHPGGQAIRAVNLAVAGAVNLQGFQAVGEIFFPSARIGGTVSCYGATFSNPDGTALDFANAEIQGNLWLSEGMAAHGLVRLVRTVVTGDASCLRSTFHGRFVARGMTVGGGLTWRELGVPLPEAIDLLRARVAILDDDEASWPDQGGLAIDGFSYDRFGDRAPRSPHWRITWIRRQHHYTPEPYQQLASVYRRNGQTAEATIVAMAQQDDLRRRGELNAPAKAWNWFLGRTIGHGYRPARAAWGLLLLYAVTLASITLGGRSDAFIQVGNTAPQTSVTSAHCGPAYPCFSPPAYTLENITPILNLHQAENWAPRSSSTTGSLLRDWLYLSTILGYATTTLLAAALSGLLRQT